MLIAKYYEFMIPSVYEATCKKAYVHQNNSACSKLQ